MSRRVSRLFLLLSLSVIISCSSVSGLFRKDSSPDSSVYDRYASRYFYMEGVLKSNEGKYDAGMDLTSHALQLDTLSSAAYYNMAQYFLATGNVDKSEQFLKRAINMEPENYWYQQFLATVYTARRKTAEAISQYEQMMVKFPGRSELLIVLANLYDETGQYEKELRLLERYARLEDVEEEFKGRRFLCYLFLNEMDSAYYEVDNPGQMIRLLLEGVANISGVETVLKFSSTVAKHRPDIYEPYYYSAIINNIKDDTAKVFSTLDEGIGKVSDRDGIAQLYSLKGQFYYSNGMTDQAFICYDSALVYNPDETVSLNNYAYFLSLQGRNLEQALAMSARTLEKEPLNATYLDTYAWILFKLQRYEEALSYLEKALRYMDEDNADIYEHYGDVLYMCGEKEKALENWHRAVQLNSESTTIERKIKEEKYLE